MEARHLPNCIGDYIKVRCEEHGKPFDHYLQVIEVAGPLLIGLNTNGDKVNLDASEIISWRKLSPAEIAYYNERRHGAWV